MLKYMRQLVELLAGLVPNKTYVWVSIDNEDGTWTSKRVKVSYLLSAGITNIYNSDGTIPAGALRTVTLGKESSLRIVSDNQRWQINDDGITHNGKRTMSYSITLAGGQTATYTFPIPNNSSKPVIADISVSAGSISGNAFIYQVDKNIYQYVAPNTVELSETNITMDGDLTKFNIEMTGTSGGSAFTVQIQNLESTNSQQWFISAEFNV